MTKAGFKLWLTNFGVGFMAGSLGLLTMYLRNRHETAASDLILPALVALIAAMAVASALQRLSRRQRLAGLVAVILANLVIGTNFEARLAGIQSLLQALLPVPPLSTGGAYLYSLTFAIIVIVLAALVGRLISGWVGRSRFKVEDAYIGLIIATTIAFGLLLLPTLETIALAWAQYTYKPPQTIKLSQTSTKPDIYYIVLEDYASQAVLKSQFSFDNQDFINYLRSSGFYLPDNSHQNFPFTTMSVASTLNASYLSDTINHFKSAGAQTIVPYHRAVQYAAVPRALKGIGYSYDVVGNWYETTNRAPLADRFFLPDRLLTILGWSTTLNSFSLLQLSQSWFGRWYQQGLKLGHLTIFSYHQSEQASLVKQDLAELAGLANQRPGGRFIFAHLMIPHEPYVFNPDGSLSANILTNDTGSPLKTKYTNQIQFINQQLHGLINTIKAKSNGQAIIVLQSDEGPEPLEFNHHIDVDSSNEALGSGDMTKWSSQDLAMKYGELAAYYIPGASAEALQVGANNVDIFRLIFNTAFGAQMDMLPECYYAYPNGRDKPFLFRDITRTISGQACPKPPL